MSQVKLGDIRTRLEVLNKLIERQGLIVCYGRGYGLGNRLDLFHGLNMREVLASDMTRAECYDWINAAIKGIDLFTYGTNRSY